MTAKRRGQRRPAAGARRVDIPSGSGSPRQRPGGRGSGRGSGRAATTGRRRKGRRRGAKARFGLGWWLKWIMVTAIWGFVFVAAVIAFYAYDLPRVSTLPAVARQSSITVLSADGKTLATYGGLPGEAVRLSDLPPYLPQAVLAIEDRRFYSHFGIDPIGMARAMVANLRAGRIVQGGSTITQQLAKNLFLAPERTIKRKIQEMLLALWLEHRFTKNQILTLYLNRVYLGAGTYGVDAAARRYFGRPAAKVSLYEAAMLAGLLQAPSRYAPTTAAKLARARTRRVLRSMVAAGFISTAQARAAAAKSARFAPAAPLGTAPRYFTDWVVDQLRGFVGTAERDLVVTTTLDTRLQSLAEADVGRLLKGPARAVNAGQAALVALSPNGAVRAMVGGRDYRTSQFNRATQALRQPGSAFKLFVFLAALENGVTPNTLVTDAATEVGNWHPSNYDHKYLGLMTVARALALSRNTIAVRLAQRVGLPRVVVAARRLGITTPLAIKPSLALGASEVTLIELTAAYAVFANGGDGVWPYGITEVRDLQGRVLYRRRGSGPGRVVAPKIVAEMNRMLSRVLIDGTGRAAWLPRPAAGKTGTSQDWRDAWFVGYTSSLVTGVWLGNDNNAPMKRVTGGGLPARLWRTFMEKAVAGTPPRPLPGMAVPPPLVVTPASPPIGEGAPVASTPATGAPVTGVPAKGKRPRRREVGPGFLDRVLENLGIGR